jgi:di- and tripeptidase
VFAVHELLKEGLLDVNVIFLIEGEEESGSHGFLEALDKHRVTTFFLSRLASSQY